MEANLSSLIIQKFILIAMSITNLFRSWSYMIGLGCRIVDLQTTWQNGPAQATAWQYIQYFRKGWNNRKLLKPHITQVRTMILSGKGGVCISIIGKWATGYCSLCGFLVIVIYELNIFINEPMYKKLPGEMRMYRVLRSWWRRTSEKWET